ncbi:UNVERIFIED_ORG: hypothetical protein M2442_002368 [Methylorubrum zatmanii]|nr:hypothetical protein [Methylorubrum zatmanii]
MRQPSTKSGRIGRSIRRETSVSFSEGTAFALEVAAGDAAGGVGALLVVHGERQEVDAGLGLLARDHGGEHGGLAVGGDHGAVRLAGGLAGLEDELAVAPDQLFTLYVEHMSLAFKHAVG